MTITFAPALASVRRRSLDDAGALAETRRIERQRTLMAMLPDTRSVDALKQAMLDRARDLLRNAKLSEANELLGFLPSKEAQRVTEEVFPELADDE